VIVSKDLTPLEAAELEAYLKEVEAYHDFLEDCDEEDFLGILEDEDFEDE
jgi:hypothetical protein